MRSDLSFLPTTSASRRIAALMVGTLTVSALGLAGCSGADTSISAPHIPGNDEPLRISTATTQYTEIFPALYDQAFRSTNAGREETREAVVGTQIDLDESLTAIRDGQTDVVLVCSGDLLAELNPTEAERIADKYRKKRASARKAAGQPEVDAAAEAAAAAEVAADAAAADEAAGSEAAGSEAAEAGNDGQGDDPALTLTDPHLVGETYASLVAQLPSTLAASDPSPTQGCERDPDLLLPNNVVPVYRKTLINVDDRQVLNWVSGAVNDGTMKKLDRQQRAADDAEVAAEQTAETFLRTRGLVLD